MPEDVQTIEGRVERLIYGNEATGFAVVELALDEGGRATLVGLVGRVEEGDALRAVGSWEDHPRFGHRFRARIAQPVTPRTLEGIRLYLAGPRVEGVGPEIARRLVETFGSSTLEVLDTAPERLTEVPGIGPARAKGIAEHWRIDRERREFLVFLQGHGLGQALSLRVTETLGDGALSRVREDPYLLVERVSGIGFRTADRLARGLGLPADAPRRLQAGLIHVLDEGVAAGHTALPGDLLLQRAGALLGCEADPLRHELRALTGEGRVVLARPEGRETTHRVYLAWCWELEQEAAARLLAHLAAPDPLGFRLPRALHRSVAEDYSPEQVEAMELVLRSKVAVLTGGPGVGKTTVMKGLVRVWRERNLDVALASPTGRAAKRLEEVSGLEASTVHRLLRFDAGRGRFVHDADHPLAADIVVVDEVSMLDLPLFLHLLRSLPEGARLLLVGDADQLPSVGPGKVLEDLAGSGVVPVARLTTIFRQAAGSRIVAFAHEVLRGEARWGSESAGDVVFVTETDPRRGAERIARLLLEEAPRAWDLEGVDDVQILTPMHKGEVGTLELNGLVQRRRCGEEGPRVTRGEIAFRPGDRVMQQRNDYDRELYNGDLGRVVELDAAEAALTVDFGGSRHRFAGSQLNDLLPAWAVTVHKSQGGEYPVVILPLFTQHQRMLERQVVYTAVTRARTALVLVGDPVALDRAVRNDRTAKRFGHLRDWLAGAEPEVWSPRGGDAATEGLRS